MGQQLMKTQRNIQGNQYVKNYQFTYNFPAWGACEVTMTSVLGHLTGLDFDQRYKHWKSCPPSQLFDAPTVTTIETVGNNSPTVFQLLNSQG